MTYPPETSDSVTGRIVAFVVAGLFVLLLGFWVASRQPADARPGPPELHILEPGESDVVGRPVLLRFRTTAPLEIGRGGWGAGPFHVHVHVDDREIMPGADDIVPLGNAEYRWTLSHIEPGTRTLRLTWSDAAHRVLTEGASAPLRITVREPSPD
jgi:hypothetical protein